MNETTNLHRKSAGILAAAVAFVATAGALAPAAMAQSARQSDKNNMRNLGIGLGGAAAVELLQHHTAAGLVLGAGAAYAAKKYEDQRKAQAKDNREYRRYRYHRGHKVGYYTYRNGHRTGYHSL